MPGVTWVPVDDGETAIRHHIFIAMETPPSSCSLQYLASGSSRLDDRRLYAHSVMTCQRLATALAALILLTPMLLFAELDVPTATIAPAHEKNATRKVCSVAAAAASPRLPSEPAEDTPVHVISSNHGLTAHVSYWNGQALIQLRAQCQDRNGLQRSIMVTLDAPEVEALTRDIARAENMLRNTISGHVMLRRTSSSGSFPPRTQDDTDIWRWFPGRAMYAPPCGGSLSITRASYAPPETAFNTTDACSRWSAMTSPRLPGPPSWGPSGSRTPWPSFWHRNRRT